MRLTLSRQCYFYMRLSGHGDANHYAYPLDFCVEMSGDLTVKRILVLPSAQNDRTGLLSEVGIKPFDRNKIHPTSEYHPDLVTERRTTKPYQVVQPEGPSFQTQGNLLTWEKWRMRVGFNYVSDECSILDYQASTDPRSVRA